MEAGASTLTDEALEATDKDCAPGGDVADTDRADGAPGDAADDSAQKKRKKAFRFLPSSDVILLKEVIKHTPWAAGHGKTEAAWGKVASGIKAALPLCTADGKACRRRFYTLMEVFKREELESLRASGTTEDYEEREQLLTDCFELTEGHAQQKADKTEKEKRDAERREAASADIVRSAMQGMRSKRYLSSDTELATPPSTKKKKRSSTDALLGFLEDRASSRNNRHSLKERQLQIDERRLALEEQRQQQDKDKTDRMLAMMSSQMGLMVQLIEKISK
ncbi:hypothetical protein GN244_ATG07853 [Phytophthora infestans]|uniref:Myb-like domain-containing protein n=1 Tax=Phytophthora infestans TaxID=4787 RepID=A0A833WFD1_PHYIN|nr:hypothetical protein GN244_ATG07853 [Phytophthora infestans]